MQLKFDETELFIEEISKNPLLEILFWDNYQKKHYSTEINEKHILSCLDKLLETEQGSIAALKSIKGGILVFSQYSYKNIDQGINLLKQAAALGNINALHNLAYCYLTMLKDSTTAITLYEQAANKGFAKSQFNLGTLYFDGEYGVTQDFAKSLHFYTQAHKNNHPIAAYQIGWMYECGYGVPADQTKALEFYKQSAEHNHLSSLHCMADIYNELKQFKEESSCYEKIIALEPFNDTALHNLAYNYAKGKGVPQNNVLAAQLNRRSLFHVQESAQIYLHLKLRESQDIEVLYQCYVDNHLPEFFALLIDNPEKISQLMREDAFLTHEKRKALFFNPTFQNILEEKNACNVLVEWYLYYAEQEPEEAENYCSEELENLQCAPRFDRNLANRLYYFMAIQYQLNENPSEAMLYCLKTRQHTPADHLLAHIIFTHMNIQDSSKLQITCLYLLREETKSASCIFDRNTLLSKILHLIKYGKGLSNAPVNYQEVSVILADKKLMAISTILELELDCLLKQDESGEFPPQAIFQERLNCFIRENHNQHSALIFFEKKFREFANTNIKTDFLTGQTISLNTVENNLCLQAADSLKQAIMPDRQKWLFFSAANEMPETVKENIFTYYQRI